MTRRQWAEIEREIGRLREREGRAKGREIRRERET